MQGELPEAVAILVERYDMSERRASSVIGADRTSIIYRGRRPDDHDLRDRPDERRGQVTAQVVSGTCGLRFATPDTMANRTRSFMNSLKPFACLTMRSPFGPNASADRLRYE